MKRITSTIVKSLVAILIGSGSLGVDLQAQNDLGVTVSVPFTFSANGQNIAAGTYQVSMLSSHFLLSILNVNTGREEVFAVRPERERLFASHGRLIFRQCAGRSVLSEVHIPGADTFSEMIEVAGRRDIEAKGCLTGASTSIALR